MDCFPVWVVTTDDADDYVFQDVAGVFPPGKLDLAVELARKIGGQVHPGAMSSEINFDRRVNIAGDAPAAGSS